MRSLFIFSLACCLAVSEASAADAPPADHAQRMTRGLASFQREIAPLLKEHCLKCHGGEATKADFDMATREDLLRGGKDGPTVIPFDGKKSLLVELISHAKEPNMPKDNPKLSAEAIAKICAWINDGAPYAEPLISGRKPKRDPGKVTDDDRKWWSFMPLQAADRRVPLEPAKGAAVIDRMLLDKAKDKGLAFDPPADSATLVRRLYLDLTGIPPTPEELQSALPNPNAAIEKLLASPRFGERWARHWLDVARFAESTGFEQDYDRPFAFHYRDFVIKALNMDMPYDQFVRWQLAGDEYKPDDPLALPATGFLGAGVFPSQITANEVERTRYDALDDMLSTTGGAMLGLAIGCARCHDNKYDPIPSRDYYAMLSTFTTTVRSNIDVEMDKEKTQALKVDWDKQRAKFAEEVSDTESALRPKFNAWLSSGMADIGADAWTLLKPESLKSNAKAVFKELDDGSYLVSGENGAQDVYTITAATAQRGITALRLEALTDASMKRGGPGRAGNGNFALGKFSASVKPANGEERKIAIARAFADHEQNKGSLSVAAALDEDPGSGWAVDGGGLGKNHAAVFVLDQPLDLASGEKLVIKLAFTVNTQHNIGRPRLSLTSAPDPSLQGGVVSAEIAAAAQKLRSGNKLAETDSTVLFNWWKQREATWKSANGKLADHLAKEPRSLTTMMICGEGYTPIRMHTQGADFFEQTYFLKRGNPDLKDGEAKQGFLQVLSHPGDDKRWQWQPPEGAKYSGRRRSLSNWITDVDHGAGALVARVLVNRLWQHHFGTGIVSTPNDFGKTGNPPTQPELLDWLASQLIAHDWKMKPIHEMILRSQAYRQSCRRDAAKETADPANALFMRRTPQRLEAEAIRDSMLAVSGLLDETMYGAGTRDENSKRRSIYFNIKRSQLIGSMVAFDLPEPLVSQGNRPTTTVAPQALILMNSPQARAWAEALAARVSTVSDLKQRIANVYQVCFSRSPRSQETASALEFIRAQQSSYEADKKPNADAMALADYCQVLLGLNEFVYVN